MSWKIKNIEVSEMDGCGCFFCTEKPTHPEHIHDIIRDIEARAKKLEVWLRAGYAVFALLAAASAFLRWW